MTEVHEVVGICNEPVQDSRLFDLQDHLTTLLGYLDKDRG